MNRLPLILLLAAVHSAFAAAPASSKESTEKDVKTAAASTPSAASQALVTPAKAAPADQAHFDQFPAVTTEATIQFPRQMMCKLDTDNTWFVEGYWRKKKDDDPSTLTGMDAIVAQYPFPVAHAQPWPRKDDFVTKMWILEHQKEKTGIERLIGYGVSPSRLTGEDVGSGEFHDNKFKVVWPAGFVDHYIDRHNVIPSLHFFRYVHARAAQFGAKTSADTQRVKAEMVAAKEAYIKAEAVADWNNSAKQDAVLASFTTLHLANPKTADTEFQKTYPNVLGKDAFKWYHALITSRKIAMAYYKHQHLGINCPGYAFHTILGEAASRQKKLDDEQ